MTYKICEWDASLGQQTERDATPEEAAEIDSRKNAPVPVPQSVSPLQIRIALRKQGLRDALDAAVAQGTSDERDAWEFATEIRRDNALVAKFAQLLGKTDADVNALFILADSI